MILFKDGFTPMLTNAAATSARITHQIPLRSIINIATDKAGKESVKPHVGRISKHR